MVKKAEREPARPPARNLKTACWRVSEAVADTEAGEARDGAIEAGEGRRRSGTVEEGDWRAGRTRLGAGDGGRRAQMEWERCMFERGLEMRDGRQRGGKG